MRYKLTLALTIGAMLFSPSGPAKAAEAAIGVYLLGSRGPMAGFTPPPGLYFNDDTYFFSGKIGGGLYVADRLPLVANVNATS